MNSDRIETEEVSEGGHMKGYGKVYKEVMRDTRLSAGEKGLYAYLCAYAGGSESCYPSRSLISHEMGLNKDTVTKYMAKLRALGYIKLAKPRGGRGRFENNRYIIVHMSGSAASFSDSETGSRHTGAGRTVSDKTGSGQTVTKNNKKKNNSDKMIDFKINKHKTSSLCVEKIKDPSLKESFMRFIDMRQAKGKPLNDMTVSLVLDDLRSLAESESEQKRIVDRSVVNSWMNFYPIGKPRDEDETINADDIVLPFGVYGR